MSFTLHPRTRKFLIGLVGIWLLLGVETGLFYSRTSWPVLVPITLVAGLLEWVIITVLFLELDEESWFFSMALYPLLLLAVALVGTLTLLMHVFFE